LGGILFNLGREDLIGLLEPLMNEELPDATRVKVLSWLTPAYAHAGKVDRAHEALEQAERFASDIESDELRARLLHRMGIAAVALSLPFDRAKELFTRAQTLANDNALFTTSAAALGGLATLCLLYEDDTTKFVWYAHQAMNAAAKAGDRLSMQLALLHVIEAETRRGNMERLPALEQQFATVTTTDTTRFFYIIPTRAMLAAWQGRFDEAYRQMSTIADKSFYNFDRLFNTAMQALYAVTIGLRERAIDLTAKVLKETQQGDFQYLYGQRFAEVARLLCAITEAFAGRPSNAQRILSRKPIVDGPPVSAVREAAVTICRAVKNPALSDEVADALAQLHAVGYGGMARVLEGAVKRCLEGPDESAKDLLTKAELDVLNALAQGRSPKDIALETRRSVYTIQAHIQNVIRKLGCSGRHEALSVARRRGLVG
jgi:DNA-binding CsgD family transcriptional regulator